ncbi:MAG TPA: alpha/beta fold hydrolase [Acidimicrobiales bacterium]|nr:alpha/beta fold hydrolase [Acidimicrobiales bacterium]
MSLVMDMTMYAAYSPAEVASLQPYGIVVNVDTRCHDAVARFEAKMRRQGDGPVTEELVGRICIHGAGSGPWAFAGWADDFPGWEVVAPDLQEGLDLATASMADYAAAVHVASEGAVGLAHTVLCGWSMGGLVALMATHTVRTNMTSGRQLRYSYGEGRGCRMHGLPLEGQVAVVAGATRGAGRGVAIELGGSRRQRLLHRPVERRPSLGVRPSRDSRRDRRVGDRGRRPGHRRPGRP